MFALLWPRQYKRVPDARHFHPKIRKPRLTTYRLPSTPKAIQDHLIPITSDNNKPIPISHRTLAPPADLVVKAFHIHDGFPDTKWSAHETADSALSL
jgi:hypothetical protein